MSLLPRLRSRPPEISARRLRQVRLAAERHTRSGRVGLVSSRFTGRGAEAAGVRPYQPGDPVRSVDWRVTARMDELHIRSWHAELELPVLVAVDTGPRPARGAPMSSGPAGCRTVLEAAWWLLSAAAATGHPVGALTLQGGGAGVLWQAPARGRGHLQGLYRLLVQALEVEGRPQSSPACLLAEAMRLHSREALILLVSPFQVSPGGAAELRGRVLHATRRHQVTPVWIDLEPDLPRTGLFAARGGGGRSFLVDGNSRAVRARYRDALGAWRAGVLASLSCTGQAPAILDGSTPVEAALAAHFTRRTRVARPRKDPPSTRGTGWRGRGAAAPGPSASTSRPPTSRLGLATRLLGALLLGGLSPDPATAVQGVGPGAVQWAGQVRVVSDTLLDEPVLGSGVERTVRLRTPAGVRPRAPEAEEGEVWDVRAGSLTPLAGDTLWEVRQTLVPWWMGSQRLPALRLARAGAGELQLQSRRVEVHAPAPPSDEMAAESLAPDWPDLPPAPWYAHLVHLPVALLVMAAGFWGAWLVRGRSAPARGPGRAPHTSRAEHPVPLPRAAFETRPPREALDLAMTLVRGQVGAGGEVDATGWTAARWRAWADRTHPTTRASSLERVVQAADEPRFAPEPALHERVQAAVGALEELGLVESSDRGSHT